MNIERTLSQLEGLLEFSAESFVETFGYENGETVGTARIKRIIKDEKFYPGFDLIELDFPKVSENDNSAVIKRVPSGVFQANQPVEVLIKKSILFDEFENCRVSIKPFVPKNYGKGFSWDQAELANLFTYNDKDENDCPQFFRRYFGG